ncbi:hypothetical protein RRM63_003762, partial [Photobacterium damselae]|nr:hypothetical protein [Photobacterium damselae]
MNKIKDPLRKRYDCFLIWGHGLEFLNSIIEEIESSNNFRICHIEKKKINNIKKFIKKVYSFDYAPWEHLKNKTRYLYNQKKEVCFIFVENLNPDVEFVDVGNFRHSECMNVKKIKSSIRNKYNPQINNKITHNHIIHATDNEFQTYDMLELAAVNKDILKENEFLLPYFLNGYKSLNIKVIDTALLICSQIE